VEERGWCECTVLRMEKANRVRGPIMVVSTK
jgi:hypothetical protein